MKIVLCFELWVKMKNNIYTWLTANLWRENHVQLRAYLPSLTHCSPWPHPKLAPQGASHFVCETTLWCP